MSAISQCNEEVTNEANLALKLPLHLLQKVCQLLICSEMQSSSSIFKSSADILSLRSTCKSLFHAVNQLHLLFSLKLTASHFESTGFKLQFRQFLEVIKRNSSWKINSLEIDLAFYHSGKHDIRKFDQFAIDYSAIFVNSLYTLSIIMCKNVYCELKFILSILMRSGIINSNTRISLRTISPSFTANFTDLEPESIRVSSLSLTPGNQEKVDITLNGPLFRFLTNLLLTNYNTQVYVSDLNSLSGLKQLTLVNLSETNEKDETVCESVTSLNLSQQCLSGLEQLSKMTLKWFPNLNYLRIRTAKKLDPKDVSDFPLPASCFSVDVAFDLFSRFKTSSKYVRIWKIFDWDCSFDLDCVNFFGSEVDIVNLETAQYKPTVFEVLLAILQRKTGIRVVSVRLRESRPEKSIQSSARKPRDLMGDQTQIWYQKLNQFLVRHPVQLVIVLNHVLHVKDSLSQHLIRLINDLDSYHGFCIRKPLGEGTSLQFQCSF